MSLFEKWLIVEAIATAILMTIAYRVGYRHGREDAVDELVRKSQ